MNLSAMRLFFKLFLSVFFLGYTSVVYPQNFHVTTYTVRDGLPDNYIKDVLKDEEGFIWIATYGGLVRYDGHVFETYSYNPEDKFSLSDDSLTKLFVDSDKNFWVGTSVNGLNRFNRSKGVFERYLAGETILSIYEGDDGAIWIGGYNGLLKLDEKMEPLHRFKERYSIDSIFEIDGELYFSTRLGRDGALYKLQNEMPVKVKGVIITFMLENTAQPGSYWLGSNTGLYLYDPKNNDWHEYLEGKGVTRSVYYDANTMAVATLSNGIVFFDVNEKKIKHHLHMHDSESFTSIVSDSVRAIYKDDAGLLWSGTNMGLMTIKPSVFSGYRYSAMANGKLKSQYPGGFLQDEDGSIWMGTKFMGLVCYDPQEQTFDYYPHPQFEKIYAMVLYQADDEHILVGSRKGLLIFNFKKRAWIVYDQNEQLNKYVYSIAELESGKFLLGSSSGLIEFDFPSRRTKAYLHDKNDPESLKDDLVIDVRKLSVKYKYAISTASGLSLFDSASGKFINNIYLPPGNQKNQNVHNVVEDDKGALWINHGSSVTQAIGIFSDQPEFSHYIKNRDWMGGEIESMIEDGVGDLWFVNKSGLLRLDQQGKKFRLINHSDGLPFSQLSPTLPMLSRSGELYFSALGGYFSFNPANIKPSQYSPPVRITEVQIDSERVPLNKVVKLTHENRSIRINFVALDYSAPGKNQYAYKLEGFDRDWVYTGVENKAVYTNIPAGDYTFTVKGSNSDGVWSEHQARISLKVKPPWWFGRWAYVVYALLLVVSVMLIVKIRTLQIKRYANKLKNEVATQTEHIKQLLDKKNELFAHVSHELRTPLTLILGPVSQLLKQNLAVDSRAKVEMIQRNSQRLLKMVDQLLTLARASTPGLVERYPQDVSRIINLVLASVKPMAMDKDIVIESNCITDVWVEMMPDALETILLNLCVNAIKYTPNGGRIYLEVCPVNNGLVEIKVCDTGPGIPEEQQDSIFERFTRIAKDGDGVGLGLALVKELLVTHQGTIRVESSLGNGTRFILQIPVCHPVHVAQIRELNVPVSKPIGDSWCVFEPPLVIPEAADCQTHGQDIPQILIIDDEKDMGDYLLSVLSQYSCHIEYDGQMGIDYARKTIPDLILSDIMMPQKNGFEVVKELRDNTNTSHIPIILLTAKGDQESRIKAYSGCVDGFITKPFDANELIVRVQAALSVRELIKQRFNGQAIHEKQQAMSSLPDLHPKDKEFLNQFRQMVEAHFQEGTFNVKEMVGLMNMSERPLQRKLKALLGLTPYNYLKIFRLEKAAEYLKNNECSIDEVLEKIGMHSRSHFYSYFKAYFGMTPNAYKQGGHAKHAKADVG